MSVPYLFQNLTGPIPLSDLDANFSAVETDITTAVNNIANGTTPLTTPALGNATATSLISYNGVYSTGQFTATGSYSDGIVMDYVTSNGRFSTGAADGFTWYNGGIGNTPLFYLAVTGNLWQIAPAPTSISAVTTLTAAQLQADIINTTGTTYTVTLPTGAAIDTAFIGLVVTNFGFDFHVVNTATGTITIAVGASGMTSVGALTIATGVSAHFRLRRTAANTYVLYRLS
jgi:hypothetical protein